MSTLDPTPRRAQLGRMLRELREAARLKQPAMAGRLGVAQSTVSRWESGRAFPSPDQLDEWAAAVGASTQQRVDLGLLAEAVATEVIPWRHRPRRLAELQADTADLEASCRLLRGYHPVLVNSLLQVPGYAQASYQARAALFGESDDEVAAAVTGRMAKQAILYRPGYRFEFVLTEAGLRWRWVPREVMAAQLDRLAQAARMPNVLVGIIPMEAGAATWGWHGFAAFLERDDAEDLVLVETLTAALTVRNPLDVGRYDQAFGRLLADAVTGPEAAALLERLQMELR